MSPTVQVNSRGQVTLPAELRHRLGLEPGSRLEVQPTKAGLLLKLKKENYHRDIEELRKLFANLNISGKDYELIRKWRAQDEERIAELERILDQSTTQPNPKIGR